MDYLKKPLFIYLMFIVLAVFTYSCCSENYRIIGNGKISIIDHATTNYYENVSMAIVTGRFDIEVVPELEMADASFETGFLMSAYATSCGESYTNEVVESSLKITTDKPFTYVGKTIAAGTDLIEIEDLQYSASFAYVSVSFTDDLMSKLVFDNETYLFSVSINTTDDLMIQNSISVKFELD